FNCTECIVQQSRVQKRVTPSNMNELIGLAREGTSLGRQLTFKRQADVAKPASKQGPLNLAVAKKASFGGTKKTEEKLANVRAVCGLLLKHCALEDDVAVSNTIPAAIFK
ncbi:MAG: hypothetical protein ABIP51_16650, partial [Bacteroidia bacterium]